MHLLLGLACQNIYAAHSLCDGQREQSSVAYVVAYVWCCFMVAVGKYSMSNLPSGPRGVLFRSLLSELQPLLVVLEAVAKSRRKTMSQVSSCGCLMC